MDNNQKNEFDALSDLQKVSWNSLNERRVYEWKFSLALWVIHAAFIGSVFSEKVKITNNLIPYIVIAEILIFIAYIWWLHGLSRACRLDLDIHIHYLTKMKEVSGVEHSNKITERIKIIPSNKIDEEIEVLSQNGNNEGIKELLKKEDRNFYRQWQHGPKIAITFILCCSVVLTVWSMLDKSITNLESPDKSNASLAPNINDSSNSQKENEGGE